MAARGRRKTDASKQDLDKLQGTWLTVSLVHNGRTLYDGKKPPDDSAARLVYRGNQWIVKVVEKTVARGMFKIDARKKPKQIDVLDETGMKNEMTKLGIYEIKGDTYKFCLASAGKRRPGKFESKEGSGVSLGVSKRQKQKP